jgi:hypothetical protein
MVVFQINFNPAFLNQVKVFDLGFPLAKNHGTLGDEVDNAVARELQQGRIVKFVEGQGMPEKIQHRFRGDIMDIFFGGHRQKLHVGQAVCSGQPLRRHHAGSGPERGTFAGGQGGELPCPAKFIIFPGCGSNPAGETF